MKKQANKTAEATTVEVKTRIEDKIYEVLSKAVEKDPNIKVQPVTGYVGVKYGNKILLEFHDKKRSTSHLTFSTEQKVYSKLKNNGLILRVVPASYGWKFNTECLLTDKMVEAFEEILNDVVAEAQASRNLKDKKETKKEAKTA